MTSISDLRAQILKARMDISTKRVKNTNVAKNLKRKLAQELTKLNLKGGQNANI